MDPMTGLPQPGMPPNGAQQGPPMPPMAGPSPMGPAGANPMQMIIQMLLKSMMGGGAGGMPGMSANVAGSPPGFVGGDRDLGNQPGMPPAQGPGTAPWSTDLPGRGQTAGYGLPTPAGQPQQAHAVQGIAGDKIGIGNPPGQYGMNIPQDPDSRTIAWQDWINGLKDPKEQEDARRHFSQNTGQRP